MTSLNEQVLRRIPKTHGELEQKGDVENNDLVAAGVYLSGERIKEIAIEDDKDWSTKERHVVWIGLHEPSADVLHRIQDQLSLHYLAKTSSPCERFYRLHLKPIY